jgi:alpha-galactosidase
MKWLFNLSLCFAAAACSACSQHEIRTGDLVLSFNKNMQLSLSTSLASAPLTDGFADWDVLYLDGMNATEFALSSVKKEKVNDAFGNGIRYILKGESSVNGVVMEKEMNFSVYDQFPSTVISQIRYTNFSGSEVRVSKWETNRIDVLSNGGAPAFWSFQGESTESRNSWLLPISDDFYQRNYMGMNDSDYGGGIPVTCLWRRDAGLAIGHLEPQPRLVSLPVTKKNGELFARIHIEKEYEEGVVLKPNETLCTYTTFVSVYKGDCFAPLRNFSRLMEKAGVVMPESEPAAFEPAWCAWGYERTFTMDQILATLPKVKELGLKWATVDDGFQIAEGDWDLNKDRFPGGDADMKKLVDEIHKYGLKAQLWWAPMAADPGTAFLKEHPGSIILSRDGKPRDISWWDSWYLSPVDGDVLAETRRLVEKFIGEYGFDGLKLDGQHMNCVPPDYSSAHHPDDPEKSVRELPDFYKTIYETARNINPHAVIQNCPCGCCISFYNLAYANQTVASDPLDSRQVRTKGYVLRALAPGTAYYGDHVELSDNGNDFPSQLGIGAVPGTKFTFPADNPLAKEKQLLTPEKEAVWKNVFAVYNEKMLSLGEYVPGLYDIGFDTPETHVIQKDGKMYYAFYTKNEMDSVELRGLEKGTTYQVNDYYHHIDLGEITATDNTILNVNFQNYLLIEVIKTNQ